MKKGTPVLPKKLCSDDCLKSTLDELFQRDPTLIDHIAAQFAIKKGLHNGATIRYFAEDGYRNTDLVFWDAQNQEIVYPFTEIDDYGSVPPIFPVGDGYFNPTDWIGEVDHNSYVFPAINLINEMKEFVEIYPKQKSMLVTINDREYLVKYDPAEMENQWSSPILEVLPAVIFGARANKNPYDVIYVRPGDPSWREAIVEETNTNIKSKNAALLALAATHAKGPEANAVVEAEIGRHAKSIGGRKTRKNKKHF
jgi:hypothetical protein